MNRKLNREIFLNFLVGLILCTAFCLPTAAQQPTPSPTPTPSSKKQAKLPFAIRDNTPMSSIDAKYYQTVAKDYEEQRTVELRNRLIFMAISQIDLHFRSNERGVRHRNRLFQTVVNILEVGAATAISITNGERAKTVIADGLGFIQGSRDSINKNYKMLERQILVNKMVEKRAKILAAIYERVDLSDEKYPFERAFIDLLDYFEAGRLDSALTELAKDSGSTAANAESDLKQAKRDADIRLASSAEQIRTSKVNSKKVDLFNDSVKTIMDRIAAENAKITTADGIINDANSTEPQKAQARLDKTAATTAKGQAETELAAAKKKYDDIFDAIKKEAELAVILEELPEAYPKISDRIRGRLSRIDDETATPEDYAQTLLQFYGRLVTLVGTDDELVAKATEILAKLK